MFRRLVGLVHPRVGRHQIPQSGEILYPQYFYLFQRNDLCQPLVHVLLHDAFWFVK
jgi:hypothetical protein